MSDELGDFRRFAIRRERAFYRYAHLLTGDHTEAEHLVRDALGRTQATWRRINTDAEAELHTRRAITAGAVGRWRPRAWFGERMGAERTGTGDAGRAGTRQPGAAEYDIAARTWIRDELQTLPPRQRAALVLRYYEHLGDTEIAQILGCSITAAQTTTTQAMQNLRAHLDPDTALLMDLLLPTRQAG